MADNALHDNCMLPSLADSMKIDLAVGSKGEMIMAYDQPFRYQERPQYAEYDRAERKLWFHSQGGFSRELGLDISDHMDANMKREDTVAALMCVQNNHTIQGIVIPVLMKGTV